DAGQAGGDFPGDERAPGDDGEGSERGPEPDGPRGGSVAAPGPSFAAEVNLTLRHLDLPLLTAAGHARHPGEAPALGALDPALARRLAEAAARHPDSTFCVTIVSERGHAIAHGCCRPARDRPGRKGQRDGPPSPPASGFTFASSSRAGPPGGLGAWTLTLPGR